MSGFKIPLDFSSGNFYNNCQVDEEKSIDDFIKLLISSPNGSFKPDFRFGFSLKNYRFENADSEDKINHRKVAGKSENFNNYAIDLKEAIKQFEPRLRNTEVKIDFNKEKSEVSISISGILVDTKKEYKQDITFHIW